MELCYMKGDALAALKDGLPTIYEKYLTERDNSWLVEVCGENPFVKFRDVPDFELAPLDDGFDVGEVDFRNSKILYKNLHFLTPRQAADERFWAGFCHGAFYDYVRRRWGYDKLDSLSGIDKAEAVKRIANRFFFNGGARERLFTNTLSKYWWAGRLFGNDGLDALGSENFYTKLFSIGTRSFISNEKLRGGFIKFLQHFKERGITLDAGKHIRPAMVELNQIGGALVLDCLTESEVAAIMIEHVEKIFSERKVVDDAAQVEPRKTVVDTPAQIEIQKTVVDTVKAVKHGDTIKVISLYGGKERAYKLSNDCKRKFPDIYEELIGKKINSVVTLRDGKFKITEID